MNIQNSFMGCNNDDFNNDKCCPKVVFAILPTGPTGPVPTAGPTGPTGPQGETPTLTIGTVITGDPGSEASATITGTSPNFILNLTIPQGPTGPIA